MCWNLQWLHICSVLYWLNQYLPCALSYFVLPKMLCTVCYWRCCQCHPIFPPTIDGSTVVQSKKMLNLTFILYQLKGSSERQLCNLPWAAGLEFLDYQLFVGLKFFHSSVFSAALLFSVRSLFDIKRIQVFSSGVVYTSYFSTESWHQWNQHDILTGCAEPLLDGDVGLPWSSSPRMLSRVGRASTEGRWNSSVSNCNRQHNDNDNVLIIQYVLTLRKNNH